MRGAEHIRPGQRRRASTIGAPAACRHSGPPWSAAVSSKLRPRKRIGESAGLTLRKVGGLSIVLGSWRIALEIAVCTSCAAPSILRSSLNCKTMLVRPCVLDEVIESMPGMVEKAFSSGAATAEAMVSGSAPARFALTWMVGKSTLGSSLTGSVGVAEDAKDHQRRHDQRGHDGVFDEPPRNVHPGLPFNLQALAAAPSRAISRNARPPSLRRSP